MERHTPFKILTIDGGGIRGIFPAMFLANLEATLKARGVERWQVYQNFDFICGTSTGGILALALALGIPAKDIADLYLDNAAFIFGQKKGMFGRILNAAHRNSHLEALIRGEFKKAYGGTDPGLKDCRVPVAIPVYDLMEGKPTVLKSPYHEAFVRDYHIPAYQAALATAAAPAYFDPYNASYYDKSGLLQTFNHKVDGGVFANNPALTAIVEVQSAFGLSLEDLAVLSLGTGHQLFCDAGKAQKNAGRYGIWYWMLKGGRTRLIDLFLQAQSQQVQNLVSLMRNGIDKRTPDRFIYTRIDTILDESCNIAMDETHKGRLLTLAEKATIAFQSGATRIQDLYCR